MLYSLYEAQHTALVPFRYFAELTRGWYANPKMVWRIARAFMRHPRVTRTMMQSYFFEQSWDWQFRGDDPPMKLLRHTWKRCTR